MLYDYWPWAAAWLIVFLWALPRDGHRIPLRGRTVYQRDGSKSLYLYEERGGFNNVRQDWWREIRMLSPTEFVYVGDWFKDNVGYYPCLHAVPTFPYMPAHPSALRAAIKSA